MSAIHGSMTYTRFFVGDDETKSIAEMTKSINSRFFVAPTPGDSNPIGAGWVPIEDPNLDKDIKEMSSEHWQMGQLITLAYREDAWLLPRALVKRETARAVKKHLESTGGTMDDVGKALIKACQVSATSSLKARIPPRTKVVEVVWDQSRKEVRFYGKGAIVHERASALFERTFGVRLDAATPGARAIRLVEGHGLKTKMLARLSPSWLFPDIASAAVINELEGES